jgi:pyruvate dehydrogenase E2 component (dihydrolipoamide acetyltransferase)
LSNKFHLGGTIMATNVIMPQGGQDLEKGVVLKWWKREGDKVTKGELLCEIETEKAVFEVQAPSDGVLLKILCDDGCEAPILSVIGMVGSESEKLSLEQTPAKVSSEPTEGKSMVEAQAAQIAAPTSRTSKIEITPKAKKLALDKGISIDAIKGTGPGGRITEADVLAAMQAPSQPGAPTTAKVSGSRKLSISKQRKVIARRMAQSKQTIPHFYVSLSVNMGDVIKKRAFLKMNSPAGSKDIPSITDFITKACALAIRQYPDINCSYEDEDTLICWDAVNLGLAIALPEGLVVEAIPDADCQSLDEIARQTRKIVAAAQEGKKLSLVPSHFTISNLGMYHIESFSAIINPPESAILAVGAVQKQVVADEQGRIEVQDRMTMTLSLDHRIGDGLLAANFLNKVKSLLEDPDKLA